MQVSKWGNSLAIRIPAAVVDALELQDGDHIEVRIAGTREFEIGHDTRRKKALDKLRGLRRPLPSGFIFDRASTHER